MSDLETLLPKKGAEQAQEKQTAETKPTQNSFAERKQKCLSMIEDAALDAVADAKRYGAFLGVVSRFDRYSPNNQLLIFAQNPDAKKIGLLYDVGQDSATSAIEAAKQYLTEKGVEYIERTGTTVDEIALAAQALVTDGVDAVFTPTDNTVMKSELSIYETFADAGIPHYTGADSFALNGAFLGYGVDYANLGVETANMAAEILLDGKKPAELPVRTFDNGTATVNTEICEKLGLDFAVVKEAFAPYCTSVQEIVTAESFADVSAG